MRDTQRTALLRKAQSTLIDSRIPPSMLVAGGSRVPVWMHDEGMLIYCRRAQLGLPKAPLLGLRERVDEHLALQPSTSTWLVQPFLNLASGGAVLVSRSSAYWECVEGLPLGLLRHGELGFALHDALGAEEWHGPCGQARPFIVSAGKIVEAATSEDFGLQSMLERRPRVASHGDDLLIEWGWDGSDFYVLDCKPLTRNAVGELLQMALKRGASPQTSDFHLECPALGIPAVPSGRSAVFSRGAALSHFCTYSLGTSACIGFEGW